MKHWWVQRVTALALMPLTLWLVFAVASLSGEPYSVVAAWFARPFTTVMLTLFVFTAFYHAALGLRVVIEDYVHPTGIKLAALIGVNLLLALLGTISILAVLRG